MAPITFDVSGIVRDDAGNVKPEGDSGIVTVKKRKAVGSSVTVGVPDGQTIKVMVAEIKNKALVFEVTHPDHPLEKVEIGIDETKEIFPGDGRAGVRVALKEGMP